MFEITAVPALHDNYVWMIHGGQSAAAVDPGEAAPVLAFLDARGLQLDAILCTHRHADHTGGIAELREVYNVPVYGRRHPGNPHVTGDLREGDRLELDPPGIAFDILEIPGHLDDHLAYLAPGVLFCGDVLFGAGCGRNFEGALAQLHQSLQRLAALPDETLVYCAHEYTAANLRFAQACEPHNPDIQRRIEQVARQRAANLPTVPSGIALEKATNPFLRCTQLELVRTLQQRGLADTSELGVFTALREWRNHF
ncbi:MAG: hydroxyacylglutathione hydrolase [Gallionellales bacterium RIFCSPLOWO2_12_FULL_59_22]|nr:MAG: hydroxyacylglutathione hydrolase [Gallionellales bacterium RIFCSPLOWO2_02_FULL_59_110]OGT05123.1 MAG: hydroxyacylglutathione hydrolase [Gallionellales bacterium RIFCSPLOWO2_02_58_13]OGT14617.1 MAG: hydroxyacylglutathione hydrolase [Gallionellales bacterium RIFCSPLOWO2_12_FULL_59_22]